MKGALAWVIFPRAGRPSYLLKSEEAIDVIMSCMLDRQGPAGMARRLNAELGIRASQETVRRFVKRNLGRPLRPVKKPRLTEAHKQARLNFAKKWVRRCWDNVVVTDSKYFWLCPRGVGRNIGFHMAGKQIMSLQRKTVTRSICMLGSASGA